MSWLQKRGGVWWIGWRNDGKEFRKSTGETEKEKAKAHLEVQERLEMARRANALTEEFYRAATGREIVKSSASKFLSDWLAESETVTSKSTIHKYRQVVREFSAFVEVESKALLMEDITVD